LYRLGWYQNLSNSTSYGVDFSTSISEAVGLETVAQTAAQFNWDANTSLKAKATVSTEDIKVNPQLRFAVSVAQRISDHVEFIVGADFNGRHLFNTGPEGTPHSLGFEINLV